MKNLFNFVIVLLLLISLYSSNVSALEKEPFLNKSQMIVSNEYAEKYCSAKDNYFFEGLDNERTLKYSYFRYIGLNNKKIYSKEMYKQLILQIREKCKLTKEEEREINQFLLDDLQR